MHLIAKVVRISHANFHCNRLTAVQDIQYYASLILGGAQCNLTVRPNANCRSANNWQCSNFIVTQSYAVVRYSCVCLSVSLPACLSRSSIASKRVNIF